VKPAVCHSDRPSVAKGQCRTCYDRDRSLVRYSSAGQATCHPNRKAATGGLCHGCYSRARGYVRPKRVNRSPARYDVAAGRRKTLARHGLTVAGYEELVAQQNGRCLLCRQPTVAFHVDHDHETGLVRGLLCQACNRGLGFFGDDPELLLAAADYVRHHRRRAARSA
jgi:recombination endonuclease VII